MFPAGLRDHLSNQFGVPLLTPAGWNVHGSLKAMLMVLGDGWGGWVGVLGGKQRRREGFKVRTVFGTDEGSSDYIIAALSMCD